MKVQLVPFLDVFKDASGGNIKTPQSEFLEEGDIPVVDQGHRLVAGYVMDRSRICRATPPVIVFGDHTRAIKYVDFDFAMGADGTKVFVPRSGNHPKYLYHALKAIQIPSAGYSRHYKFLKEMSIPLPPLAEQRRIAGLLDAADALRVKRHEALAQLDTFLQSTFVDMFGDPATNPKEWQLTTLPDIAIKFTDGPFGSNLKSSHYVPHGVRVIRLQNIGVGELLDDDLAFISADHFASLPRNHCNPSDVLIGTLGEPNLRACVIPPELEKSLNKADCLLLRVDPEKVVNAYVCWLLNCPGTVTKALGLVRGQTRGRISLGRLKALPIPLPPLALQHGFAAIVESVEQQKARMRAHLAELDALFASLQSRAFSGTL